MLQPNREATLAALGRVAMTLPPLGTAHVFVGGAVVALLITDPAAPDVRETRDVDAVVNESSRAAFEHVQERLRSAGWSPDTSPGAPLCRWRTPSGDVVDVMPSGADVLGFSNRWYALALAHPEHHVLASGTSVPVIAASVFVLTKFEAFESRGRGDVFGSHDLEDLVSVFEGRPELDDEMCALPLDARRYAAQALRRLLADPNIAYALPGLVDPTTDTLHRATRLLARLTRLSRALDASL